MNISIQIEDPFNPDIMELLQAHLDLMTKHTPGGSGHALNLEAFRDTELTFWSARNGYVLLTSTMDKDHRLSSDIWFIFSQGISANSRQNTYKSINW